MKLVDLIFLAFTMLYGQEDQDYWFHERSREEWQLISWIHRN